MATAIKKNLQSPTNHQEVRWKMKQGKEKDQCVLETNCQVSLSWPFHDFQAVGFFWIFSFLYFQILCWKAAFLNWNYWLLWRFKKIKPESTDLCKGPLFVLQPLLENVSPTTAQSHVCTSHTTHTADQLGCAIFSGTKYKKGTLCFFLSSSF